MGATEAETDAASLRRAFDTAAESFPASVSQFLDRSRAGQLELERLTAWWRRFYEAIRDHQAGLKLLAEMQRLKELDGLRRLELADTDAALADLAERYRVLKERLAKWQAEHGELTEVEHG